MPYTPSTAAQNTATLAGSNLAGLASPLTSLQTSIAGGNLGPAANMDAILSAVGYQVTEEAGALGTASTTSTTFVDVGNGTSTGFTSWAVTVPVTKSYLVHVDLTCTLTVAGGNNKIYFQLLVNGSAPSQVVIASSQAISAVNTRTRFSWRTPIAFTQGSRSVKLQWKVDSGATAQVTTSDFRCFTLTG